MVDPSVPLHVRYCPTSTVRSPTHRSQTSRRRSSFNQETSGLQLLTLSAPRRSKRSMKWEVPSSTWSCSMQSTECTPKPTTKVCLLVLSLLSSSAQNQTDGVSRYRSKLSPKRNFTFLRARPRNGSRKACSPKARRTSSRTGKEKRIRSKSIRMERSRVQISRKLTSTK